MANRGREPLRDRPHLRVGAALLETPPQPAYNVPRLTSHGEEAGLGFDEETGEGEGHGGMTGAAGRLMEGVMARARAEGVKVTPLCGYAAAWLRRHKAYADLLA